MRKSVKIFIGVLIVETLALAYFLHFDTKQVYPFSPDSNTLIGVSHEGVDSNFSQGNYAIVGDSVLRFSYTLSNTGPEPFTGVYLHRVDSLRDIFIDFSDYDRMNIVLKSKAGKRIPVFLTLDYKGFTNNEALSSLPLVQVIEYDGPREYHLDKKNFEIPSWWLRYHQKKKEEFTDLDFSRLNYLVVNSCQTLGAGASDEIEIQSITFSQNNWPALYFYLIAVALTMLAYAVYLLSQRKKKVLVPYRAQSVSDNESNSRIEQIVQHIAEHYMNPDLSIEDVQKDLGISTREIGNQIKTHLGASFKSYLNTIRLTEAKRLLTESDLAVSEIGYKCGYNNIPHFNRVFKKETELTPKEFREGKVNG